MKKTATVVAVESKARLRVELGSLSVVVPLAQLELIAPRPQKNTKKTSLHQKLRRLPEVLPNYNPQHVPTEIDLHGRTKSEARELLSTFIHRAALAGHEKLTIIHGVGTGALRQVVQEELKRYNTVARFVINPHNVGETLVYLC